MAKSKFTANEKALIRKLHDEDGISYAALAARFNVAPITINRICRPDLAARQAEARKKYRENNLEKTSEQDKKAYRTFSIKFHKKNDMIVIKHLEKQESMQGYLRELILADIEQNTKKS